MVQVNMFTRITDRPRGVPRYQTPDGRTWRQATHAEVMALSPATDVISGMHGEPKPLLHYTGTTVYANFVYRSLLDVMMGLQPMYIPAT